MAIQQNSQGYLFSRRYSNYVFILLFLLYMFDYIDRMVVTSMFTHIEADWGISHTQSGLLVSAVRLSKNLYSLLITLAVRSLTGNWSFVP